MFKKLMELFKKKNIEITEEELKEIVGEESLDDLDDNAKRIIKAMDSKNKALEEKLKTLTDIIQKEKEYRENAIKSEEERLKAEKSKKVDEAVNKLFLDKKIAEAQKEHWKKMFETSFEDASKIAEALEPIEDKQGGTGQISVSPKIISDKPIMNKIIERNNISPGNN
jgi:hypothetical protein